MLPSLWASRNRARRREKGDLLRGILFGGIGLGVMGALFVGAFWLTWQAAQYAELGDYLIRIGLSWLFLTFLSFLAFSGIVAALSTFFLSDDLRLVLAAPVAPRRLFLARFARTVAQAGWMVVVFLVAGPGGHRDGQVRIAIVRRYRATERGAVRRHSDCHWLRRYADARQRVSGAARRATS